MKNEVGIKEVFNLLKSKWKLILTVVLAFVVISSCISFSLPTRYEAKVDLLVNYTEETDEGSMLQTSDIEMSLRLIETYKYMLKSDRMLVEVNSQLAEPYSKLELMDNIAIESSSNSQVITIVAREKTREKSAVLANTYATKFQEEIKTLMNLENIIILNIASVNSGIKEITLPFYMISFISFIIGSIVSTMIIIAREFYSSKLTTSLKVESILEVPNLGTISFIKSKSHLKKKRHQWDEKLVSAIESPTTLTEEFRRVRANIQFHMSKRNVKTILVTSPVYGDGKSFISGNLAVVMAIDGKKTVFVDANLRKPIGRRVFNLPERKGLTSIVLGQFKLNEVLQKTKTENLSFISAGPIPPNPTEVLSSSKMKFVIERLKEKFDVIIIDTSSLVVADAISLSTTVDGCLYVLDAGSTKELQASKSLEELQKVGAPILGTILNRSHSTIKKSALE